MLEAPLLSTHLRCNRDLMRGRFQGLDLEVDLWLFGHAARLQHKAGLHFPELRQLLIKPYDAQGKH